MGFPLVDGWNEIGLPGGSRRLICSRPRLRCVLVRAEGLPPSSYEHQALAIEPRERWAIGCSGWNRTSIFRVTTGGITVIRLRNEIGQRGRSCTCVCSVPSRGRWLLRYALMTPSG